MRITADGTIALRVSPRASSFAPWICCKFITIAGTTIEAVDSVRIAVNDS